MRAQGFAGFRHWPEHSGRGAARGPLPRALRRPEPGRARLRHVRRSRRGARPWTARATPASAEGSGKVELVQDLDPEDRPAGFLVFVPVYAGGRVPETVDGAPGGAGGLRLRALPRRRPDVGDLRRARPRATSRSRSSTARRSARKACCTAPAPPPPDGGWTRRARPSRCASSPPTPRSTWRAGCGRIQFRSGPGFPRDAPGASCPSCSWAACWPRLVLFVVTRAPGARPRAGGGPRHGQRAAVPPGRRRRARRPRWPTAPRTSSWPRSPTSCARRSPRSWAGRASCARRQVDEPTARARPGGHRAQRAGPDPAHRGRARRVADHHRQDAAERAPGRAARR